MKGSRILLIPLVGMATSCVGKQSPNIVYVFPDQFRTQALSFWGDPEFKDAQPWVADPSNTPRLNAFAREALVLNQATSTCPLSSPYRGMFLTGLFPQGSGIYSNCMAERPTNTLNPNAECISDVLAAKGYDCGYIGKLHAEVPMPNDPANPGHYVSDRRPEWDAYTPPENRHGFNYWYSYGTFDEHWNPHYWDTEGVRHDPRAFSVVHETQKAVEYIKGRSRSSKPFFLCVAYNPPHSPYDDAKDCLPEDYALYEKMSFQALYRRPNADTTMLKAPSMRAYLANVTAVDTGFGAILDALRDAGIEQNTIVVFTSDHGETMCSHGTPDPKNSIWAESFEVPFLIRWPSSIKPGVDSLLLESPDIMPTLLGLAGIKVPERVQGRDFSQIFLGKEGLRPEAALYLRNENGTTDRDGMVLDFFPVARGIKTQTHTFEIAINRDTTLKSMVAFDDVLDPYQLHPLDLSANPELRSLLVSLLYTELERSGDVWVKEKIIETIDIL